MNMDPKHLEKRVSQVDCVIVTVSDTRTVDTDGSGRLIRDMLVSAGHRVVAHDIVPDEPGAITDVTLRFCQSAECQVIVVTGGTGLAGRDTTYEALSTLYEKKIDGFGELFRMISYAEIGAAAMLSRASAGLCQHTAIFSLPGSTAGVRLAMDKLILPQICHLVGLIV